MTMSISHNLDQKRATLTGHVTQTRRRLRRNAVWAGLALLTLAAVSCLTLAAVADALLALPVPLRVGAWAGFWLIAAAVTALAVLRPALRTIRLQRVALEIERALGRMHNRLVTILDLNPPATSRQAAPDDWLVQRLVEQTWQRMADYEPSRVADARPARRLTLAAILSTLVLFTLLASFNEPMTTALRRIAYPTHPIPPASWLRFDIEPGDVSVLHGDSLTIHAHLTRGSLDPDDIVLLRLTDDHGRVVRHPMTMTGTSDDAARFTLTLESIDRSYDYRIETAHAWAGPHRIERVERPRLENVEARILLPAYMNDQRPRAVTEPTELIDAVRGATLILEAHARSQVSEAAIELLDAREKSTERTERDERVWFDDDLPADAELIGQWRWVDQPVRSGQRAHGFQWNHEPYGFRTRLEPLVIETGHNSEADEADTAAAESFYVFVRLDPREPAEQLTLTLQPREGEARAFQWTSDPPPPEERTAPADHGPDNAARSPLQMGALPAPGQWHRLEIPAPRLAGDDEKDQIVVTGVRFAVRGGQALFDRAGAIRRVTRQHQRRVYEPVDTLAMSPTDDAARWRGRIEIKESDLWYRVHLINERGLTNRTMRPVPIRATRDQPPTLHIERPGRHIAVTEARPVPLVIRAHDDYGVSKVLLQTSPDRAPLETLEADTAATSSVDQHVLATYNEPRPSRTVAEALSAERFDLDVDEAVYYRALAVDTAGQRVASSVFRFVYESSDQMPASAAATGPTISAMLERMGELIALDEAIGQAAGRMLDALPPGVSIDPARGRATLVDRDGQPLDLAATAEAMEQWREALATMESDDEPQWHALRERLEERRQHLSTLSERMREAAEAGRESQRMLVLEPEVLEALARSAEHMAEATPDLRRGDQLDAWALQDLARLQTRHEDERAELAALESEMAELWSALHETGAADLSRAHERIAALHQRMQTRRRASQHLQRMQATQARLVSHDELVASLEARIEQLRQRVEAAEATDIEQLSEAQAAADAEALAAMEALQPLLEAGELWDDDLFQMPVAPWQPPGEERTRTPTEADELDVLPEADEPDEAGHQPPPSARRELEDPEAWWDQPIETPLDTTRWRIDERYADRLRDDAADRDADQAGAGEGAAPTPRDVLMAHQQAMADSLTAARQGLGTARDTMSAAEQSLARALAGRAPDSLQRAVGRPRIARAVAMAQIGLMQRGGSDESGGATARRGHILPRIGSETREPRDDRYSAAIYRLPPELREPVRQAMREQGPSAYQPLIESYYRRLSDRVQMNPQTD